MPTTITPKQFDYVHYSVFAVVGVFLLYSTALVLLNPRSQDIAMLAGASLAALGPYMFESSERMVRRVECMALEILGFQVEMDEDEEMGIYKEKTSYEWASVLISEKQNDVVEMSLEGY